MSCFAAQEHKSNLQPLDFDSAHENMIEQRKEGVENRGLVILLNLAARYTGFRAI